MVAFRAVNLGCDARVAEGVSPMPQVIVAVLIGAGIGAGMKWLAREMTRAAEGARMAHEHMTRANPLQVTPKDLGTLVWDADAGVYRPGERNS